MRATGASQIGDRAMSKKLGIGTFVAVLLMSGLVVGRMSQASEGGSDRLATLTLNTVTVGVPGSDVGSTASGRTARLTARSRP